MLLPISSSRPRGDVRDTHRCLATRRWTILFLFPKGHLCWSLLYLAPATTFFGWKRHMLEKVSVHWLECLPSLHGDCFFFFFFFRMALNTQCHAQSQFVWSMHLFLQVLTAFDLPVPLSVVKVSGHPHERLPTSQRAEAKSEAPWPHSSLSVGPRDMVPVWSACVYTDGGLSAVEN